MSVRRVGEEPDVLLMISETAIARFGLDVLRAHAAAHVPAGPGTWMCDDEGCSFWTHEESVHGFRAECRRPAEM